MSILTICNDFARWDLIRTSRKRNYCNHYIVELKMHKTYSLLLLLNLDNNAGLNGRFMNVLKLNSRYFLYSHENGYI